ncbi:MAG TPA: methylenetetrahydrofolate reductase [Candidatus Limnocylindria bacterium]|nr:methylenetetrahydrofolate reductase [Candidatus Limnocylindria bacterium]
MSTFRELIRRGEFVVTAELNPPKSADASLVRRRAEALKGFVDAVNVTDSNRAVAAMAAMPAAVIVRESGVDPIVQMTGRDRNRIALQADLLGAAALGFEHFVFMSGDDPKQGNHPDAVNVKDLDGIGLVKMAVSMRDQATFLSGDPIKTPPDYVVGATASPFTKPMEADLAKTVEKVAAGAEFLQTQPVFDLAAFGRWLAGVRRLAPRHVAIIAGVLVLRSAEQAERIAKIPGLALDQKLVERVRGAADQEAEGVALAAETVRALRALPGVGGVHLYAIEWPEGVTRVVEAARLLPRPTVREAVR